MEKQKQKKKILNILMPVLVLSIVFWIFHRDYRAIWHSLSSIPAADVLLNMVKLSWLYLIPFYCLKVLDVSRLSVWNVQVLSSVMLVITGALPNVAGMGPAEFAFLLIFTPFTGRVPASTALILYRAAAYFFPFILSTGIFLKVRKN